MDEPLEESDEQPVDAAEEAAVETSTESAARPLSVEARTIVAVAIPFVCAFAIAAFGFGERALVTAITGSALVYLSAIDIEQRILPNRVLVPVSVVVLILQLAFFPDRAVEWILAGVTAAAFLGAPRILRRDAMGMGDVKLGLLLGFSTGWNVFTAILLGCLAMVPIALWMLSRKGSIRGATLPFGPFLAFGTLAILFTS